MLRARSAVPPTPQRRAVAPTVATALAIAVFATVPASPAGAAPANSAPAAPANLTTYPPTTCGDAANPTWLSQSMANPTFTAGLADPDGNNLRGYLEIRRAEDGSLAYGPAESATVPSGTWVTWPAVPDGNLAVDGTVYYVRARAQDTNDAYGPYSGDCYFRIDSVDPGEPTITSTDFPVGAEGIASGTAGIVTFTPAAGDTDILGYRYGFDNTVSLWAPADAHGRTDVPITVWGDPFFPGLAQQDLWVMAVDRAGNRPAEVTGPRTLIATDTGATPARRDGDVNGDGMADVAAVLDAGVDGTAAWTFLSAGTGFHPATVGWGSGVDSGYGTDRIKTTTGDFDHDGRADIALFRQEPDGKVLLFNLRSDSNQYRASSRSAMAGTWRLSDARVVSGDFTGDGTDDVAAIVDDHAGGWAVYVYRFVGNAFTGGTTPWYVQPAGGHAWADTRTVAGDFTGDGRADLAVAGGAGNDTTLSVYASTGAGFSAGAQWWDSAADAEPDGFALGNARLTVADLDGNGADDVVALYRDDAGTSVKVKVLTAAGTGFAAPRTWWTSGTGGWNWNGTAQLSVGDFDNDADVDLAAIVEGGAPDLRELWTFPNLGGSLGPAVKQSTISTNIP